MTRQLRKRFIIFIVICGICAGVGFAQAPADPEAKILKKFVPPLSADEKELLQSLGCDQKEIDGFVATRLFLRRMTVYTEALPKAIKYNPHIHGCPQPPSEVDFKYMLSDEEASLLYDVKLECSMKEKGFTSKCGQEKLSLSESEIAAAAGAMPEKASVLAKLVPPALPEEEKLFDKACTNALEIPKFLATRIYFRKVNKMIAALPAGVKFDPDTAPEPGKDVDFTYTLNKEDLLLWDIKLAWAKKKPAMN
jgi:hypothetical protein